MSSANKPVSVSVLTDALKHTLNQSFGRVWVQGEISTMTRPRSGHIYFSLKDEFAQLSAVIWRTDAQRIPFDPKQGQKIICGGFIDVYATRGVYQLVVKELQPIGIGAIELAWRQLHEKLKAEGLFELSAAPPARQYGTFCKSLVGDGKTLNCLSCRLKFRGLVRRMRSWQRLKKSLV